MSTQTLGEVPTQGWPMIQQSYSLNTATEPRNHALNNYAKRDYYTTKLYISHHPIKQNRTKTKQSFSIQIYASYHPLIFSIFLMKPWSTYNCPPFTEVATQENPNCSVSHSQNRHEGQRHFGKTQKAWTWKSDLSSNSGLNHLLASHLTSLETPFSWTNGLSNPQ